MALGDVLGGYLDAAAQHHQTILGMEYQRRADLSKQYIDLAQSDKYPEEARQEFLKRGLTLPTMDLGNKVPKEWENMTVQVQPPAPPPITAPGSPGTPAPNTQPSPGNALGPNVGVGAATADVNPQHIQPPTPPPTTQSVYAPLPYQEAAKRSAAPVSAQLGAQNEADIQSIKMRNETLGQLYPDMDPEARTMIALKMPMSSMQSTPVTNVKGADLAAQYGSTNPSNGQPWDANGLYTILHDRFGKLVNAYQTNSGVAGGIQWGELNGQRTGFYLDRAGQPKIVPEAGFTPLAMLPKNESELLPRIVPQADGTFKVENVTSSNTKTIGTQTPGTQTIGTQTPAALAPGGVAAPTPPPNMPAPPPRAPTPPTRTNTNASTGIGNGARSAGTGAGNGATVGARALTPAQVMTTSQKAEAYQNTIDRITGVLSRFDSIPDMKSFVKRAGIAIQTDPNGIAKMIYANNAPLSDDEAKFASDYTSLGEDVNVLRDIYSATGFRGPEAFKALMGQRGNLLSNPKVFKGTLTNTLQSIVTQMAPLAKQLARAGQPLTITEPMALAYKMLNKGDAAKARTQALRDGWQLP